MLHSQRSRLCARNRCFHTTFFLEGSVRAGMMVINWWYLYIAAKDAKCTHCFRPLGTFDSYLLVCFAD